AGVAVKAVAASLTPATPAAPATPPINAAITRSLALGEPKSGGSVPVTPSITSCGDVRSPCRFLGAHEPPAAPHGTTAAAKKAVDEEPATRRLRVHGNGTGNCQVAASHPGRRIPSVNG